MKALWPAVVATLFGDTALAALVSDVRTFRRPKEPASMVSPVVVLRPRDHEDEPGLHGAAVNPEVEVEIWGYGPGMFPACMKAAQRVSEVFLSKKGMGMTSGALLRWREILGWAQIDEPDDADVVLLRATFRTRYWATARIAALTS